MANIGQIQRGLTAFIDNEIAPKLSGVTRIIVAGSGGVLVSRLPVILSSPSVGGIAGTLALMDQNGEIDLDVLYTEFKRAIQQTGAVTVDIPIPFAAPLTMSFRDADLDKLYQYIKQQP